MSHSLSKHHPISLLSIHKKSKVFTNKDQLQFVPTVTVYPQKSKVFAIRGTLTDKGMRIQPILRVLPICHIRSFESLRNFHSEIICPIVLLHWLWFSIRPFSKGDISVTFTRPCNLTNSWKGFAMLNCTSPMIILMAPFPRPLNY